MTTRRQGKILTMGLPTSQAGAHPPLKSSPPPLSISRRGRAAARPWPVAVAMKKRLNTPSAIHRVIAMTAG
jgi:hypothetical protein